MLPAEARQRTLATLSRLIAQRLEPRPIDRQGVSHDRC